MKDLIYNLWTNPKTAKKFWVAIAGAVILAASSGLLPHDVAQWITVIGPFIVAGGVYKVQNKEPDTVEEAEELGLVDEEGKAIEDVKEEPELTGYEDLDYWIKKNHEDEQQDEREGF